MHQILTGYFTDDLYYIHNAVYSATDMLYAQGNLIGCDEATLVRSRNVGCLKTTDCLNQLLIPIRSSLIVCNHVQSKTRLVAIIDHH